MALEKTRNMILDAARRLFARKGEANTTMNDVAVTSGVGRRTLYNYFESKEQLYLAVVESELERLSASMSKVANKKISPESKIVELIHTRLDAIKEVVYRNGSLRANFFRDIWTVEKVRRKFDATEIEIFKQVLKEGVDIGDFYVEHLELTAQILHYCVKGIEVPYIRGSIGVDVDDETSDRIVAHIIAGALINYYSMGLLTGKTALVTGAARGIGKAIALKFASEGANVAFTDLVIDENGKATEEEIAALGVKAKGYASNAADFAQTETVVNQVKEDFGSIDILVNNAGITKDGLMMRMSEAQWDAVINVNLKSAFNFIHACTPIMMRQRSGSIINMSSVVGVHGNAGQCNYAASKAGLIALAKSIGQEIGSRGIRANAIAPGFIDTAMTQALPEDIRKAWIQNIPLRRAGTVEDIANVATFLASDLSSYVTGQVIQVDGGMNM